MNIDQKYISYYFRNLCVNTFPSSKTDFYFDTRMYDHFLEFLLRETDDRDEFNMLIFIDKFIRKLQSDKQKNGMVVLCKKDDELAKRDFLKILSNMYEIALIYKYKDDLSSLKEILANLNNDHFEQLHTLYSLEEGTLQFIKNIRTNLNNALSEKIDFKYTLDEYDKALSRTFALVEENLQKIEINKAASQASKELPVYRTRVFESAKKAALDHFVKLKAAMNNVFTNHKKIMHLKNVKYYLSFLLHDELITLEENHDAIFANLYLALMYAYKVQIYFLYFKDKYEKVTLKELITYVNSDHNEITIDEFDTSIEYSFFDVIKNIEVRQDFTHLPLLILGYQLSLDATTVEKIAVQIDNDGLISDSKTKNPNVQARFKDLKHKVNIDNMFDLDNSSEESLKQYRSYYTKTLYEANMMNESGQVKTISFDSKKAYINYITPLCDEDQIQNMVDNYLYKKKQKVYYEPLFEISFTEKQYVYAKQKSVTQYQL